MSRGRSLDEVQRALQPNPDRHWIIPGAVRAGACIAMYGGVAQGRLLAAEMAVSALTFTRFMGTLPPWIAAQVAYLAADPYSAVQTLQKLLAGRLEDDTEGLDLHTPPSDDPPAAFWDEFTAEIVSKKQRLVVVDDILWCGAGDPARALLRALKKLSYQGVTSVVCYTGSYVGGDTPQNAWADAFLHHTQDRLTKAIRLTNSANSSIATAVPSEEKTAITWTPYPRSNVTAIELEVWQALYKKGKASASDVGESVASFTATKRVRTALTNDVLEALLAKDEVLLEKVPMSVGGKNRKIWSVKLPEREDQ